MENLIFCGVINPEFLFLIQDVEVIVNTPKKSAVFETLQKIFWRWCKMREKAVFRPPYFPGQWHWNNSCVH